MRAVCKKSVEKQGTIRFQEGKSYILTITEHGLEAFNEQGMIHFLFDIALPKDWV